MLKLLKQVSLCMIVILCNIQSIQAQSSKYNIFRGDNKIGAVNVARQTNGDIEKYTVKADVNFRVILKYHRNTKINITYRNDKLYKSTTKTVMNEELKGLSKVQKTNNSYKCFKHPDDSFKLNKEISYSAVKLYFIEPIGVNSVFSETHLEYCDLEDLGNHKYKLTIPGGKVNYYTYENGELVQILVDRTWFDLTFKKVP